MDFVKINYTARIKDQDVFDTTRREVAEEEGILDEQRVYKPMTVVVGQGQVIEGLDEALEDMEVGEEKELEIPKDKAYGERDTSKINLVPRRIFKQEGVDPVPGMPVEIDGKQGKVQTVSGGRVRVDFNHELAGKDLVFDVKVEEKAKDKEEKAEYLVEKSFNRLEGFGVDVTKDTITVTIPPEAYRDKNLLARKASLSSDAWSFLEVDEVQYREVWENPQKEAEGDEGESEGEGEKPEESK